MTQKTITWIDNYLLETRTYRDKLLQANSGLVIETHRTAGEGYRALQTTMTDVIVINPYLAPGLEIPLPPPLPIGWDQNPSLVGFDLVERVRRISEQTPIILLGRGREIRDFARGVSTAIPTTSYQEIVFARDVLPDQFAEIMRKYLG
ncbi:TPA: hypothetical protein HA241_07885 [Candidatus Woesearchaeota archaeon]|nr:hypothetical protein [Candidatus Woesearchaeota archaeon]